MLVETDSKVIEDCELGGALVLEDVEPVLHVVQQDLGATRLSQTAYRFSSCVPPTFLGEGAETNRVPV